MLFLYVHKAFYVYGAYKCSCTIFMFMFLCYAHVAFFVCFCVSGSDFLRFEFFNQNERTSHLIQGDNFLSHLKIINCGFTVKM